MFIIIYPQELKELAALVCCESWLWWQQRTQGWVCQIRGGCFSKAALWDPPPVHRLSIDCSCDAGYIVHFVSFARWSYSEVWKRKNPVRTVYIKNPDGSWCACLQCLVFLVDLSANVSVVSSKRCLALMPRHTSGCRLFCHVSDIYVCGEIQTRGLIGANEVMKACLLWKAAAIWCKGSIQKRPPATQSLLPWEHCST